MIRKMMRFLRSLKLTVIVLTYLTIYSAASTFFFKGGQFVSPFFLVPVGIFFLNLLACATFRFIKEMKKPTNRNFGPDILHGALLVFILSATLSAASRVDGNVTMRIGDSAILPNEKVMCLVDMEHTIYRDGSPREWISYISLPDTDSTEARSLEVNHPIRVNNILLYQYAWGEDEKGEYSVIRMVWDPGLPMVMISLVLLVIGVLVTAVGKYRRRGN